MWTNQQWGMAWPAMQYPAGQSDQGVDWAALAKMWIAQRDMEAQQQLMNFVTPPPPPPEPHPDEEKIHDAEMEICEEDVETHHPQENNRHLYQENRQWPSWGTVWNAAHNADPHWRPQPDSSETDFRQDTGFNDDVPEGELYTQPNRRGEQIWGQISAMANSRMSLSGFANQHHSQAVNDIILDTAKRKRLPAWIREGLEKMEMEKQRKAALEMRQKEKEQLKFAQEAKLQGMGDSRADDGHGVQRSKFDSDDDIENDEPEKNETSAMPDIKPNNTRKSSSPKVFKTEDEKQQDLIIRVRQMLTTILLEVTSTETEKVAHEVYNREKKKSAKAPVTQLAKSSALASLTSLGSADAGFDSDASADSVASGEESDSESEAELRARSARKRSDFDKRQLQLLREIEEEEEHLKEESLKLKRQKFQDTDDNKSQAPVVDVEKRKRDEESDPHPGPASDTKQTVVETHSDQRRRRVKDISSQSSSYSNSSSSSSSSSDSDSSSESTSSDSFSTQKSDNELEETRVSSKEASKRKEVNVSKKSRGLLSRDKGNLAESSTSEVKLNREHKEDFAKSKKLFHMSKSKGRSNDAEHNCHGKYSSDSLPVKLKDDLIKTDKKMTKQRDFDESGFIGSSKSSNRDKHKELKNVEKIKSNEGRGGEVRKQSEHSSSRKSMYSSESKMKHSKHSQESSDRIKGKGHHHHHSPIRADSDDAKLKKRRHSTQASYRRSTDKSNKSSRYSDGKKSRHKYKSRSSSRSSSR